LHNTPITPRDKKFSGTTSYAKYPNNQNPLQPAENMKKKSEVSNKDKDGLVKYASQAISSSKIEEIPRANFDLIDIDNDIAQSLAKEDSVIKPESINFDKKKSSLTSKM
jgi:hypothetical protein